MKTLLVPIDFSTATPKLIATARELAKTLRSRIVLVHVVMPPAPVTNDFSLPVTTMQEIVMIDSAAATKRLARLLKPFRAARIKAEALVLSGPPGSTIVEAARRAKASFILIGSHGHGKLYDLLVGSTASSVLKHATCPVIVLPPPRRR